MWKGKERKWWTFCDRLKISARDSEKIRSEVDRKDGVMDDKHES